jgi:hypothetical protein
MCQIPHIFKRVKIVAPYVHGQLMSMCKVKLEEERIPKIRVLWQGGTQVQPTFWESPSHVNFTHPKAQGEHRHEPKHV